jgi:hypothetical protein
MLMRRAVLLLASALLVLMVPAGSAVASTGPAYTSPGQAGYAVTGAHFTVAETWVRLPDAAQFSSEIGELRVSVQLWSSASVIDLTATACTDASCRAGGKPEERRYRLEFAVYSRATGALVCSTSAAGSLRCPQVPKAWNDARIAPGHVAALALSCPTPHNALFASVNDQLYFYPLGTSTVFGQARIGAEFGATPWTPASFRAPRKAIAAARFDRPPPPPYAAEIGTASGSAAGIASWWAHHQVRMTGGSSGRRLEATASALWDDGYGFTVYLEP